MSHVLDVDLRLRHALTLSFRYRAPEVDKEDKRNQSSDVWSLGCVFLEMLTVIADKSIADMTRFFRNNKKGNTTLADELILFHTYSESIQQWVAKLGFTPDDGTPAGCILKMVGSPLSRI